MRLPRDRAEVMVDTSAIHTAMSAPAGFLKGQVVSYVGGLSELGHGHLLRPGGSRVVDIVTQVDTTRQLTRRPYSHPRCSMPRAHQLAS